MATILDTIAAYARVRVENDRKTAPTEQLTERCRAVGRGAGESFISALRRDGLSFICEVKKASPSKGVISEDFPYTSIAHDYEDAGADCISCLTEPKWFMGSDDIFAEIRAQVKLPMLRKDFVVDAYQLYQARLMGANAVLLICALLDSATLESYLKICGELGLAALVEAHDEAEIRAALDAGAQIIGVNNRNLKDFSVDINNSARLRDLVADRALFVAESGISSPQDAAAVRRLVADAVLIGEALMRSHNKAATLAAFREAR